jgi:hypothetical protein
MAAQPSGLIAAAHKVLQRIHERYGGKNLGGAPGPVDLSDGDDDFWANIGEPGDQHEGEHADSDSHDMFDEDTDDDDDDARHAASSAPRKRAVTGVDSAEDVLDEDNAADCAAASAASLPEPKRKNTARVSAAAAAASGASASATRRLQSRNTLSSIADRLNMIDSDKGNDGYRVYFYFSINLFANNYAFLSTASLLSWRGWRKPTLPATLPLLTSRWPSWRLTQPLPRPPLNSQRPTWLHPRPPQFAKRLATLPPPNAKSSCSSSWQQLLRPAVDLHRRRRSSPTGVFFVSVHALPCPALSCLFLSVIVQAHSRFFPSAFAFSKHPFSSPIRFNKVHLQRHTNTIRAQRYAKE